MEYLKKEVSIGFLISIIATGCGVFLYVQYFSKYGFEETIQMIQKGNLYAQVLSLAALPNLFVFFVFIKKKQISWVGLLTRVLEHINYLFVSFELFLQIHI